MKSCRGEGNVRESSRQKRVDGNSFEGRGDGSEVECDHSDRRVATENERAAEARCIYTRHKRREMPGGILSDAEEMA